MELPRNVQPDQLISLTEILSNKLTGSTIKEIRAINSSLTDKQTDGAEFLGLIYKKGEKFLLTEIGKKFSQSDSEKGKNLTIRETIKTISIFNLTIENFHHNKLEKPTKLDVGAYWNEHFHSEIQDLNEEDLIGSIIFFFRTIELAGLGKFINAGRGRETRIDLDLVEVAKYVTTTPEESSTQSDFKEKTKTPTQKKNQGKKSEDESDKGDTSLGILKKLNPELVWSDLDSEGARKLIIDKINDINKQNTVLSAEVDECIFRAKPDTHSGGKRTVIPA
jgi:hypothetical protein